jgi:hypothetical protein
MSSVQIKYAFSLLALAIVGAMFHCLVLRGKPAAVKALIRRFANVGDK